MKKKLIEVALPLEAINAASAKEKSIRHGHPSTLHLWWARRPLAACRAVLFASIVDDPSSDPERFPTEAAQEAERQRLFRIIEEMVKWENTTNETVLKAARDEIMRATNGNPPPVLDPFCGGGSIPLEAQRLGLEAHGSDLNPVAVLITKALIEIPPKFANCPPVHPSQPKTLLAREWRRAQGLAEDVRYYGKWMRDEAERRIGHLYPKVTLPKEQGGGDATVVAWLWVRTVKCPNPACGAQMPLTRSFAISTKKGREAWVEPLINVSAKSVEFQVRLNKATPPSGTTSRKGARCICCSTPVSFDHIRSEGKAGRMGVQMLAIVCEGPQGRTYLSPSLQHETIAKQATPEWVPTAEMAYNPFSLRPPLYGFGTFADVFTQRQLVALTTFSDLVGEARERVRADAGKAGRKFDEVAFDSGGTGTTGYADAIATYLAFAVDRGANYWSSLTPWGGDFIVQTFGRQALPMIWDYAEGNPFSSSTGNFAGAIDWITKCIEMAVPATGVATVEQLDAASFNSPRKDVLVCTDPPYYNNIDYADLSDYFYIWIRHSLGRVYPQLLSTLQVPKAQELVATPYRFEGDRQRAEQFFEEGLGKAFSRMRSVQNHSYPLVIFYAFKQMEGTLEEDGGDGTSHLPASTGWETMLEGLLKAGFTITGTWPSRTERDQGLKSGMNVLASSIVLVCRPRPEEAKAATQREFLTALKRELPTALKMLQHGNVAPVDLAQASIGPGMAVFSRFSRVVESDGKSMRVRTALQLINQTLDEVLTEQEGEYDADTRFAIAWFEQHAHDDGLFGQADVLARAKNCAVAGLVEAGIVASRGGKVRLLRRDELAVDWDPTTDTRLTIWEVTQQLIRAIDQGGEMAAATLLRRVGERGEAARDLAYRLYTTCERKGWAQEALAYNSLVVAWPQLTQRAGEPVEGEQLSFMRGM